MSDRVASRLAGLADRFDLAAGSTGQLSRLLTLVCTDPLAPTAIRDPDEVVDAHIADALVAIELGRVAEARRIADLGSGAGFPGLVLAAALPSASIWLLESNRRKCEFIERAISVMGLTNAVVVAERAEGWVAGLRSCDLVTARALAALAVLVEYAAPILRPGGALVAWKGHRDPQEEADAVAAAHVTGMEPSAIRAVHPWNTAQNRHLHLYVKVGSTPNRYPRRPGMASKRPLRAST